jgi:hypothetical protein
MLLPPYILVKLATPHGDLTYKCLQTDAEKKKYFYNFEQNGTVCHHSAAERYIYIYVLKWDKYLLVSTPTFVPIS